MKFSISLLVFGIAMVIATFVLKFPIYILILAGVLIVVALARLGGFDNDGDLKGELFGKDNRRHRGNKW